MFGFFKKKSLEEYNSKNEPEYVDSDNPEDTSFSESDNVEPTDTQPKVWRKRGEEPDMPSVAELIKTPDPVIFKNPKEAELENHIGKLVICISEQLENPTVGVGVEVLNGSMLSVYDIVRKEKINASNLVFSYTEQKFDGLNQMDGNARIALFFDRLGTEATKKQQHASRPVVASEEWKKQVLEAIERINRGDWS
jgi:hypothetical protein